MLKATWLTLQQLIPPFSLRLVEICLPAWQKTLKVLTFNQHKQHTDLCHRVTHAYALFARFLNVRFRQKKKKNDKEQNASICEETAQVFQENVAIKCKQRGFRMRGTNVKWGN